MRIDFSRYLFDFMSEFLKFKNLIVVRFERTISLTRQII